MPRFGALKHLFTFHRNASVPLISSPAGILSQNEAQKAPMPEDRPECHRRLESNEDPLSPSAQQENTTPSPREPPSLTSPHGKTELAEKPYPDPQEPVASQNASLAPPEASSASTSSPMAHAPPADASIRDGEVLVIPDLMGNHEDSDADKSLDEMILAAGHDRPEDEAPYDPYDSSDDEMIYDRHAVRVTEEGEVSMDDLDIDMWDMPRPCDQEKGLPINNVQEPQVIHVGSTCAIVASQGYIGESMLEFIGKIWRKDDLRGLYAEYGLYESHQHLLPLQGDVVQPLLGAYSNGKHVLLAMDYPNPYYWQNIRPNSPSCLKEQCVHALRKVHAQGVLHGDLQLCHFLQGNDLQITIVGFQHARALVPLPEYGVEQATQAELDREMRKLMYLLAYDHAYEREEAWAADPTRKPSWPSYVHGDAAFSKDELAAWRSEADETPDRCTCMATPEVMKSMSKERSDRFRHLQEHILLDPDWMLLQREEEDDLLRGASEPLPTLRNTSVSFIPLPPRLLRRPLPSSVPTMSQPVPSTSVDPPTTPSIAPARRPPTPSPATFVYEPMLIAEDDFEEVMQLPPLKYNASLVDAGKHTSSICRRAQIEVAARLDLTWSNPPKKKQALGSLIRKKLGMDWAAYRKKAQQVKKAYHQMKREGKRLVHGSDQPQVTNGPPILDRAELTNRNEAFAKLREPSEANGAPRKGILKRTLQRPFIDWDEYNGCANDVHDWETYDTLWEETRKRGRDAEFRKRSREVRAKEDTDPEDDAERPAKRARTEPDETSPEDDVVERPAKHARAEADEMGPEDDAAERHAKHARAEADELGPEDDAAERPAERARAEADEMASTPIAGCKRKRPPCSRDIAEEEFGLPNKRARTRLDRDDCTEMEGNPTPRRIAQPGAVPSSVPHKSVGRPGRDRRQRHSYPSTTEARPQDDAARPPWTRFFTLANVLEIVQGIGIP